jgi:hypothetical protein
MIGLMDVFQTSDRPPLFFMHIPKTAGTSMRLHLNNQYRRDQICPEERWEDLRGREADVRSWRLVRGHFRYNMRALVAEDARMLTVLRDPLRRTMSALRHLRRDPAFHQTWQVARNLPLTALLRHPGIMEAQRDVQARYLCASMPPEAVAAWLSGGPDREAGDREEPPALDLAKQRLEAIPFVGITEDLSPLLRTLTAEMGYHPAPLFPTINANPERIDPLAGLDAKDIEILRAYNTLDLAVYEHAKRLIARRQVGQALRQMVQDGFYRAPEAAFEVPLSGVVPGSGWYEDECDQGSHFRWTGPSPTFSIDLVLRSDRPYRFAMAFVRPRTDGPGPLTVEVNGEPVPVHLTPEDDHHRCEVRIERRMLAESDGACQILIDAGSVTPGDGADIRPLGLLVRRLIFEPLVD